MDGAMTSLPHGEPESYHSGSWDNRISPRNSKWLQENMTDMDDKVKTVVTLINEDASSFNRKAEMYFRKRPELMKLIEELYRAYRALAERYDFTNRELEWAHQAISKAFSTQVLFGMTEDSSSSSLAYPQITQTPERRQDIDGNEGENQNLKKTLLTMHGEKDDIFLKYQQTMKKMSDLEEELNDTQMSCNRLSQQASEAKTEVQRLREAITKVEVEKDAAFFHQKELIGKISTLERKISQVRARGMEDGSRRADIIRLKCLQNEVSRLESEKDSSFLKYKLCLEKIADLERKTSLAEDEAGLLHTKAHRAETKVEKLKNDLDQVNKEKRSVAIEYGHCLARVSNLESELSSAEDEIRRINNEVLIETEKLNSAEERYAALEISNSCLESEAVVFELRIVMKERELSKKHDELEKLIAHLQEEQLRFVEVEAATLALQEFQTKEENGSFSEIREAIQILKEFDISEDGIEKEEEMSSSIEDLQSAVFKLKDIEEKLREKVVVQKGIADTLEKQIRVLKEEIKDSNERYQSLKDENSELRQISKENKEENIALSNKLQRMEQLSDTNTVMQKSFQWLNEDKLALISEKEALLFQLRTITNRVENLTENNAVLQNPLFYADTELESLKTVSENVEERNKLIVSLDKVKERLESLENKFHEAEKKCKTMERERELTLARIEDVEVYPGLEKKELLSLEMSSDARLASLEKHLHFLKEETKWCKIEFEEEVGRAVNAHFEIFILHVSIQDLEMKNQLLSTECEKHIESSKSWESLVSELEGENLEQQVEIELLISEIEKLRADIFKVFKALGINPDEFINVHPVIEIIEGMRSSLSSYEDDKQKLLVEYSILLTLLGQLRTERDGFMREKEILNKELENDTEQLMIVREDKLELIDENKELKSKVKKEKQNAERLGTEVEMLLSRHEDTEKINQNLKKQHCQALEDNSFFKKNIIDLKKEKRLVEEENDSILAETLILDNHCTVFKNLGTEKGMEVDSISKDMKNLQVAYNNLEKEVGEMKKRMDMEEMEKLSLENSVKKMEMELYEVNDLNNQLRLGISDEMRIICEKEMEVCLAEEKIKATEDLNSELCKTMEELKRKLQETEIMKENAEKEILFLHEVNGNLSAEIEAKKHEFDNLKGDFRNEISAETVIMLCQKDIEFSLSEEELKNKHKETILIRERLEKEITEKTKENENKNKEIQFLRETNRNLTLGFEEMKKVSEVWEAEASTFHFYLQVSKAYEVVLENKVRELSSACKSLESESSSKSVEMEKMRARVDSMETEISSFTAQFYTYAPEIYSIRENMASLEHQILDQPELKVEQNNGSKDVAEPQNQGEEGISSIPNRIEELHDLKTRIKSLEKVVTEIEGKVETQKNISIELEQEEELTKEMELNDELVDTLEFKKTNMELILYSKDVKQRKKEVSSPLEEDESSIDKIEVPTYISESNVGHNEMESSSFQQLENILETPQVLETKSERNKKRKMKNISPEENVSNLDSKALAKRESEKSEELHMEVQNMFPKLENGKKVRGRIRFLKRTGVVVKSFFRIWRSGERKRKRRRRRGIFRCCKTFN